MKFLAIDIEATGIDPAKDVILEFAAVLYDWQGTQTRKVRAYNLLIVPKEHAFTVDSYVMAMHSTTGLWERLHNARTDLEIRAVSCNGDDVKRDDLELREEYSYASGAYECIVRWFNTFQMYDTAGKLTICGKNPQFDLSFLNQLRPNRDNWCHVFHRRMLDPTMFYLEPNDVCPPDLDECAERACLAAYKGPGYFGKGRHTALVDATIVGELTCLGLERMIARPQQ